MFVVPVFTSTELRVLLIALKSCEIGRRTQSTIRNPTSHKPPLGRTLENTLKRKGISKEFDE